MPAPYIPRSLEATLAEAARTFPAVVLTGPRQAGKTTVLEHFGEGRLRKVFLQLTDELLADTGDPPQDCCQYGRQWNCRFRLWAELGTPRPHILPLDTNAAGTMSLDGAGGRFTTAKLDPIDYIGKFIDVCDVGTGVPNMWTTIYLYLTPESHGNFQWAIDSDCSSKSAHTGAETW